MVKTYSGGMRRRLDLGASLVGRPRVLLLDEPTTGLDPRNRLSLWSYLRDLVNDGTSVLLTTQYLEEADQLADDIVVIDHGRVIATGTPAELKQRLGGAVLDLTLVDRDRLDDAAGVMAKVTGEQATVDRTAKLLTVGAAEGADTLVEVVRGLDDLGIRVDDIALRRPSLDEVFLAITGHAAVELEDDDRTGDGR